MKKNKMKWASVAAMALVLTVTAAGCQKRCHCYGRDGSHRYFTEEELKAKELKCSNMVIDGRGLLYSLCEYDHTSY